MTPLNVALVLESKTVPLREWAETDWMHSNIAKMLAHTLTPLGFIRSHPTDYWWSNWRPRTVDEAGALGPRSSAPPSVGGAAGSAL